MYIDKVLAYVFYVGTKIQNVPTYVCIHSYMNVCTYKVKVVSN